MTSEMMKSSIPSFCASTREERWASGGPCASWCSMSRWTATEADSMASARSGVGLGRSRAGFLLVLALRSDDVLDRQRRRPADALDEVAPLPARAGLREGRDDDLVDVVEVE